jgi:hypothetical protein
VAEAAEEMNALDLGWFADGLYELEKAISSDEWTEARRIAEFIDGRMGGHFARDRVLDALMHGETV